jgi:hypothetical protein
MKHIIKLGEAASRMLMRVPHPPVRWLARSLMRRDDDGQREGDDHDHRADRHHRWGARPLTLWRPTAGGKQQWRWESWPDPRPLYGLAELANKPAAPVVVVEGEKACDAARRLCGNGTLCQIPRG